MTTRGYSKKSRTKPGPSRQEQAKELSNKILEMTKQGLSNEIVRQRLGISNDTIRKARKRLNGAG